MKLTEQRDFMKKTQKLRILINNFQIITTEKEVRKNFDHRINCFLDLLVDTIKTNPDAKGLASNVAGNNLQIDLID